MSVGGCVCIGRPTEASLTHPERSEKRRPYSNSLIGCGLRYHWSPGCYCSVLPALCSPLPLREGPFLHHTQAAAAGGPSLHHLGAAAAAAAGGGSPPTCPLLWGASAPSSRLRGSPAPASTPTTAT